MRGGCASGWPRRSRGGGSAAAGSRRASWRRLRRQLFAKPWVVYAKRAFGGPKQVFAYLGRYTHRVAISSARLKRFDGARVVFRTRGERVADLPVEEFLRRFLLHVLPRGFRKIRHYGLLSARGAAERLELARRALGGEAAEEEEEEDAERGLAVARGLPLSAVR